MISAHIDNLDRLIKRAIDNRVASAIALCVGSSRSNKSLFLINGTLGYGDHNKVNLTTKFDLASLTKVFCTTILTAEALAQNRLKLDEKPWPHLPTVTVEDILRHQSGLQPWMVLYQRAMSDSVIPNRKTYHKVIEQVYLCRSNLSQIKVSLYSDIGFILLVDLLQIRLQDNLLNLFKAMQRKFIALSGLNFLPIKAQPINKKNIVKSSYSPQRKRILQAEVDDENCYAMMGISGHAGLFGDILAMHRAVNWLSNCICAPAKSTTEKIIKYFATNIKQRPLGFDIASYDGAAHSLSRKSIGHLGFSGVSFFIDPLAQNKMFNYYILLSNRVHPNRFAGMDKIKRLRQNFHHMVSEL